MIDANELYGHLVFTDCECEDIVEAHIIIVGLSEIHVVFPHCVHPMSWVLAELIDRVQFPLECLVVESIGEIAGEV